MVGWGVCCRGVVSSSWGGFGVYWCGTLRGTLYSDLSGSDVWCCVCGDKEWCSVIAEER